MTDREITPADRYRRQRLLEARADVERQALVEQVIAALLERIYPVPVDMDHEAECHRLMDWDLAGMSDVRLADERARLRLRLMLDPKPVPWLVGRLELIEGFRRGP